MHFKLDETLPLQTPFQGRMAGLSDSGQAVRPPPYSSPRLTSISLMARRARSATPIPLAS